MAEKDMIDSTLEVPKHLMNLSCYSWCIFEIDFIRINRFLRTVNHDLALSLNVSW